MEMRATSQLFIHCTINKGAFYRFCQFNMQSWIEVMDSLQDGSQSMLSKLTEWER